MSDVTQILSQIEDGNGQAAEKLLPLVNEGLRKLESLNTSVKLGGEDNDCARLFLAMAHWQLGDKAEARQWYDQAMQWLHDTSPRHTTDVKVSRIRTEAEELLDIVEKPEQPSSGRVLDDQGPHPAVRVSEEHNATETPPAEEPPAKLTDTPPTDESAATVPRGRESEGHPLDFRRSNTVS